MAPEMHIIFIFGKTTWSFYDNAYCIDYNFLNYIT